LDFLTSPLVGSETAEGDRRGRVLLFACWLALVAWLLSTHVFWRDEVRAFSLALSGSSYGEMLRNVHGEGHPALWYLVLRAGHDLFPYREVLPIAGAVFGIAAMALVAFRSPFRFITIALVLFSGYGAFEYVVIARNYGIAALVMLALAALYGRIRNSLWFGAVLAILCNTNVPSCLLAAGFLLFRFVEMLSGGSSPSRRDWLIFAGNAVLAAAGALLCFLTVYPTFNDAAVSSNLSSIGPAQIAAALLDTHKGFSHMLLGPAVLAISCLAFIRAQAVLLLRLRILLSARDPVPVLPALAVVDDCEWRRRHMAPEALDAHRHGRRVGFSCATRRAHARLGRATHRAACRQALQPVCRRRSIAAAAGALRRDRHG
jgi:hypothetical protein